MVDSFGTSPEATTREHVWERERRGREAQVVCEAVVVGELEEPTVCPARHLASIPTGPAFLGRSRSVSSSVLRRRYVSFLVKLKGRASGWIWPSTPAWIQGRF